MGIKDFLNKKRTGWIFGFTDWVLNNPKAFSILLFIGPLITAIIFTLLTALIWYYNLNPVAKIIFTVITLLVYYKLYQAIIALKRAKGDMTQLIDSSMNDVFYGGKYDGYGTEDVREDAEDEYETVIGYNQDDGEQTERSNRSSRRNGKSFSDLIQKSGSNGK